jgi:hypothetical protein
MDWLFQPERSNFSLLRIVGGVLTLIGALLLIAAFSLVVAILAGLGDEQIASSIAGVLDASTALISAVALVAAGHVCRGTALFCEESARLLDLHRAG